MEPLTLKALAALLKENCGVYFEAFLDPDQLVDSDRRRQPLPVLPITINIYEPGPSLDSVSSVSSEAKVFLQEPTNLHPTFSYRNPHYLSREEDELSSLTTIDVGEIRSKTPPKR